MSQESKQTLRNKILLVKIPREEYSQFLQYCDRNDETINASLRRMILSEIDNPNPSKMAGKSVFEYNKSKDNFAWKVVLDDGKIFDIDNNLPANSIEQLHESLTKAIEERNIFIRKSNDGSVSLPTKLLGKKK